MTQPVEGLRSLAFSKQGSQIESENRLLLSVEQFHCLLMDPEARDAHQSANTDERLQLAEEIARRKLPYESRDAACGHRDGASQVTNPVMVPLAKAELPFGLVQQPPAKPDSPLESVVKGRFCLNNLPSSQAERRLQGSTEIFTLQLRRDLTVFPSGSLTHQVDAAYAIPKKLAMSGRTPAAATG